MKFKPSEGFCRSALFAKKYEMMADIYIHTHSQANVSHRVCPDCMKKHYPEFDITV
jgi:hypothetical protein